MAPEAVTTPQRLLERRRPRAIQAQEWGSASRRYFDPHFAVMAIKVFPGEHRVSGSPEEMLVTVLGSCVSACIRDPIAGIGGMNHFMLPASDDGQWGRASARLRYGNFAMEHLINDILKQGGRRERLEIKVFGGANVLSNGASIGHQNAEFVEDYLKTEGLPIAGAHLYGVLPRRVHYFPVTGRVRMLELRRSTDLADLAAEARYQKSLRRTEAAGSVELFE